MGGDAVKGAPNVSLSHTDRALENRMAFLRVDKAVALAQGEDGGVDD